MKNNRSHLVCVVSINCNRILFSVTSNLGIKKPQITTTPTKADAKAKPPNNPQIMVVSIGSLFTEKLHKELYYLLSPEILSSVFCHLFCQQSIIRIFFRLQARFLTEMV